jgi:hypothetical protein
MVAKQAIQNQRLSVRGELVWVEFNTNSPQNQ